MEKKQSWTFHSVQYTITINKPIILCLPTKRCTALCTVLMPREWCNQWGKQFMGIWMGIDVLITGILLSILKISFGMYRNFEKILEPKSFASILVEKTLVAEDCFSWALSCNQTPAPLPSFSPPPPPDLPLLRWSITKWQRASLGKLLLRK